MPRPGRPRSSEINDAVLEATRELLVEIGYTHLTISGVAARARVGRPAVYRRWASKPAMVFEAVFGRTTSLADPDTGSVRSDLQEAYSWAIDEFAAPEARVALLGLLADLSTTPELGATIRAAVIGPEYGRVRTMLRRGVDRGELRSDVDLDLVIDALTGAALTRAMLFDAPLTRSDGAGLVDLLLQGLSPTHEQQG